MQRLAIISAIVITLDACAPAMPSSNYVADRISTVVEVHNDSAAEAAIYVVRGPLSLRLGTVAAQSSAQLHLPSAYFGISGLAVEARAFALDESYRPPEMVLEPGGRVILRLLNPLPTASLAFYSARR